MKTVAVTGGAGFIGSHLVDRLIREDYRVIILDNLSSGKKEYIHPDAAFLEKDIRDSDLQEVFQREQVEGVFHLAAIPRVPISVEDPVGTAHVNILGTLNVYKAAFDVGVRRIVFASSSSVYGNQEKLPLQEDMESRPTSPYGLQKLVGEQFSRLFTDLYQFPIVSLRYFNVYGPRIDDASDYGLVIGKFLSQRANNQPLTIFGDGEQTRSFCYVEDVVEANIRAMFSSKLQGGEVLNVGSEQSHSVNELASLIGGEVAHLPPRAGDVRHTSADISYIKKLLGWEPQYTLEQGLQETVQWFTEYHHVDAKER